MTAPESITQILDLMHRARHGEHEAFHLLAGRYAGRVCRIVRLRVGTSGRPALPSVQSMRHAFLAAVRDFERFDVQDEGTFINCLALLVEQGMRASADDSDADSERDRDGDSNPADGPGSPTTDAAGYVPHEFRIKSGPAGTSIVATGMLPEDMTDEPEAAQRLEECIRKLPRQYREVIILHDYAGMSWDAAAEQSGLASAGSARLMRAKIMLILGRMLKGDVE